ncbi:MAG TPA: DUF1775 domain-containing protein [Gaiellaceae bacterium]|nr:DUF1775 domain-containing protein [Gaiellaceae bacterium]
MREHHRLAVLAAAVLVSAWAAASAAAHAVMQPSASRPADLQRYTLTVPNERGVPTVAVRVTVPDGIEFFLVENHPGWTTHVERRNGRVVSVGFEGGSIPVGGYDTFRFIAKNPVREGTIAWDVAQVYKGGEIVDWTGPPGSDTPASRTEIRESAVPVDTVDVVSGTTAAAATAAVFASRGGNDTLALVLACVALGLAAVALVVQLLKGRPLV